jgi:hypothetical protein
MSEEHKDKNFEDVTFPKIDNESPIEPLTFTLSTRSEQNALYYALLSSLVEDTMVEVRYGLREDFAEYNKITREFFKQLAANLGVRNNDKNVKWLTIGVIDYYSEEELAELSQKEGIEGVYARYFLRTRAKK